MHAGRVVVALVVVLAGATGGVAALGEGPVEQIEMDADAVTMDIALESDGNATWAIRYRMQLNGQNETEAFEQLQTDIQNDPASYLDPFEQRIQRTVNGAENATGRSMTVSNVSISTTRESQFQTEYGIVVYRFDWGGFARANDTHIRAGDAIDQLYLDSSTTLQLSWSEEYASESVTPSPTRVEGNEAVWQGQRSFDAGEPRLVLVRGDGAAGGTPTDTPESSAGGGFPVVPIVGLGILAVALGGGAWLYTRRQGEPASASPGDATPDAATSEPDTESEGPPPELLSNEERVLRLLEENGGRMKQKELAERLDWTAARTSQVVGDLRDEGELDSFRLGRENVLTLPDVELDVGDDEDE